jgi:hypothetical protein
MVIPPSSSVLEKIARLIQTLKGTLMTTQTIFQLQWRWFGAIFGNLGCGWDRAHEDVKTLVDYVE